MRILGCFSVLEVFAVHFINLLKVRFTFSDFEGKGYSYSQIMVHCSTMQIAPYKCFPFTRGQTQQPESFGMLVALQGQRTNQCLLAGCDLLIWVKLQFVLYPHISWCSFPHIWDPFCSWISHKSLGKSEMER